MEWEHKERIRETESTASRLFGKAWDRQTEKLQSGRRAGKIKKIQRWKKTQ